MNDNRRIGHKRIHRELVWIWSEMKNGWLYLILFSLSINLFCNRWGLDIIQQSTIDPIIGKGGGAEPATNMNRHKQIKYHYSFENEIKGLNSFTWKKKQQILILAILAPKLNQNQNKKKKKKRLESHSILAIWNLRSDSKR